MARLLGATGNLVLIVALFAAVDLVALEGVRASDISGVRNLLYMAIKSDANLAVPKPTSTEPRSATLTVKIRLSAHSRETNFFGDVPATISNFDPTKGSQEQEVWKDAQCHHERGGYPKMTVISVDGFIKNGEERLPVAARYPWIGLLLPGDIVMPAQKLIRGTDDVGPFIATHTETRKSRLGIDLKLYMLPCTLSASSN